MMNTPINNLSNGLSFENKTLCPSCSLLFSVSDIETHTQQCMKAGSAKKQSEDLSPPHSPHTSISFAKLAAPPHSPPLSALQTPRPLFSPQPPTQTPERPNLRSQSAKQAKLEEKESYYSMYTQGTNTKSQTWVPLPPVPECPVYYPNEEEFKNPMKYIASIRDEAKKFGICRIVPPSDKWLQGKPFTKIVSYKNFIFQTKMQSIHQLQTRSGPNERFLEELEEFLKKKNTPLKSIPIIDGQELDLYKLYYAVLNRGGLQLVIKNKKWKEISKELKLSQDCTSAAYTLKQYYYKYLYAYELNQKARKEHEMNGTKGGKDLKKDSNVEEEEFGYHDGKMYTLSSFKKMANAFKSKWFPHDENPPFEVVENAYWRIVENSEECVQVHYGSDLDVGTHGSGFPMENEDLKNASGWNLNIFPKLPDSLLSHLDERTAGVTEPMMYIGMLFSTFCWHTEDNHLYSINYLHHGAPKTWYGIPDFGAEQFEEVMRKTVPELFKVHPDLLFLLITMLSPRILAENHVPVYHTVQEAGQFMITFPKAYHSGFSHGFNAAESSNFALDDWFPYGRESLERYRYYGRSSVLSFEKLLCNATLNPHNEAVRLRLREELPRMKKEEQWLREKVLIKEGTWKCLHFDNFESKEMDIKECNVCKYDCYLSAIVCPCSPDKVVCLRHSDKLCSCSPGKRILLFRWRLSDIDEMMKRVGCEPQETKNEDVRMDTEEICSPADNFIGRGCCGISSKSPKFLKRNKLIGISKPNIRKLARRAGLRRFKGINYLQNELNERMFIIEKIVSQRTINGKVEYLLKWEGYPDSENTWESASDFLCPGLVSAFLSVNNKRNVLPFTNKKPLRTHKGRNMGRRN